MGIKNFKFLNSTATRGRPKRRPSLAWRPCLEALEDRCVPTVITVTGIGDTIAVDGVVTLREALTAANTNAASGDAPAGQAGPGIVDRIEFNIPGAGVHTISPTSPLPTVTDPVVIDGYTQPGASANTNALNAGINAVLLIELNGGPDGGGVGGLRVNADGTVIRGLNIHGSGDEITVNASNVIIAGNFIGTNPAGMADGSFGQFGIRVETGDNNVFGGAAAADRNLISGGVQGGIFLTGNGTLIQGNYIGTDVTGTLALNDANAGGPGITGASASNTSILGNLISGNIGGGVVISQFPTGGGRIQGNFIGTQRDGVSALGNNLGIVTNGSRGLLIGGTSPGQGNTIAFNRFDGVIITNNDFGDAILSNSIFSNGELGISLLVLSVPLPNDPGDGDILPGNRGQNYPVITSVTSAGGNTTIAGTFNSTPSTNGFRLEFFANAAADPTGFGEGQTFLGFTTVNTDAAGNATFSVTLPVTVANGQFITATATDPNGNTSEFSRSFAQSPAGPPDLRISVSDGVSSASPGDTLTYTLSYGNVGNQGATGVTLTETLPTGTTFNAAASTVGWTQTAPGSGVFTLAVANLAGGGASASARFVVTVNNPAAAGQTQIVNTASVADDGSNGADPTPADNAATDSDTLTAAPDLRISVSDGVSSASPGDTLTYTLSYANVGNQGATGVTLTETLATGAAFNAGASTPGWTQTTPGSGVFTLALANLAGGGASGSARFAVTTNNPAAAGQTQIVNTASVADDGSNGADPTPVNNSGTDTDTVTVTAPISPLAPGVIPVPASAAPMQILTFTLVGRSAAYHNELGLLLVDDASGRIGILQPGDSGYAAAALARRQVIFSRTDRAGTVRRLSLPAGGFFVLYLVQNGTSRDAVSRNIAPTRRPQVFFSVKAANADRFDHVRWFAKRLFGFEDLTGGGDRDFNDLVARFDCAPANPKAAKAPPIRAAKIEKK